MEDKCLGDRDWEKRLLWELKMEHASRDEPGIGKTYLRTKVCK
jgi:hypothetical protein